MQKALTLLVLLGILPSPLVAQTSTVFEEKLSDGSHYWHRPTATPAESGIELGEWRLVELLVDGSLALVKVEQGVARPGDWSERQPARVAELRGKLEAWRRRSEAKLPETPDDGRIKLEARDAKIEGTKLQYEKAPQKDTLGFWVNVKDTASWSFQVKEAGTYRITVLVGCGKESGGSTVAVESGSGKVEFTVQETGHFQRFVPRVIGQLRLAAGTNTLVVRPLAKKGVAVMDLRRVTLERLR